MINRNGPIGSRQGVVNRRVGCRHRQGHRDRCSSERLGTFHRVLEQIDAAIDPDLAIHVVIDNGSSHRSRATKKWFVEHPRFVVQHTPVHASWLNQVESFFSILTRKVLRRGEFDSRTDLVQRMQGADLLNRDFVAANPNERCRGFRRSDLPLCPDLKYILTDCRRADNTKIQKGTG